MTSCQKWILLTFGRPATGGSPEGSRAAEPCRPAKLRVPGCGGEMTITETSDRDWKCLYRVGGVVALVAGVLFRRNIAAEIGLFSQHESPATAGEWFALLQSNRLLGLADLNIFDVVNYGLVALMFLALYAALRRAGKSAMAIATALGLLGVGVYFASNTALSMLALSEQYAAATSEAQRSALLGAGEAMLALNRFGAAGSHPGSGGYLSLLFVATAGMITSVVMLRSKVFNRATGYVGIVAAALDLAYCLGYALLPMANSELLAILFIPAAGLALMVWHIMVGWKLYRLGRPEATATAKQS